MAVGTPTGLANDFDAATSASYVTASQSPTANRLILAFVMATQAGGLRPEIPSGLSGNGLTWVRLDDFYSTTNTANLVKQSAWAALTGASPSSGAVTITFPVAQTECAWSFAEFPGTYLTSVADALRQVVRGESPGGHRSTEVGFLAGQNSDNALWTGMSHQLSDAVTAGTGMTQIHQVTATGPSEIVQTQYRLGTQRFVDATWTTNNREGGMIGVELRAATNPIDFRPADLRDPQDKARAFTTVAISINASGDSTIFDTTVNKRAHIYGIVLYADGTVTVHMESPTKDNAPVVLHAGEGYSQWVDPPGHVMLPQISGTASRFKLSCDAAVAIRGWVAYWEDDS